MENRRSRMTKRLIKEALTDLLEQEDIHCISVRMLCEKADINRSTFYLHYETIDYLLEDFTNDYMRSIWQSERKPMDQKDYEQIIAYILANPSPYRALLKSGLYHQYILRQYEGIDFEQNPAYRQYDRNSFRMISTYTIAGTEQMLLYVLDHPDEQFRISNLAAVIYHLNTSATNQIKQLTNHS